MAKSPEDEFFEYLENLEKLVMALVETHKEIGEHRCWWDNDIKCGCFPSMKGFKDARLGCEHCSSFDRHKFFPLFKKIFWQFLEDELEKDFEPEKEREIEARVFEEASAAIKGILEKEPVKELIKEILVKE